MAKNFANVMENSQGVGKLLMRLKIEILKMNKKFADMMVKNLPTRWKLAKSLENSQCNGKLPIRWKIAKAMENWNMNKKIADMIAK